jgi:aminodeoxyfutalosine synthase
VAASFDDLTRKADAGERLADEDVTALRSSRDIITLGMLASTVRRRVRGNEVTYVRVADLKLGTTSAGGTVQETDIVPAFHDAPKPLGEGGSPADSAGEVRLFQTPHTLDAAVSLVEKARDIAGDAPLSAFCLFELSKLPEGLPVALAAVRKAGLETITQAPIDVLPNPEHALEAMRDAGLQLARLTVNETPQREWTSVCRQVAALQTRLGAIRAFAPLARRIDATQPTTGYEDVKRIAIARLLADNVETIQVDWALYGPKLAQVALTFGADDIDSVAPDDDQSHGRRRSPVEEIRRSIHAAGFEPVERDGKFARR